MHGDISRVLFDPSKSYTSVRSQQGRTHVDADDNEQVDILLHDIRTGRVHTFGRVGAPEADPGMEITIGGAGLQIGPGTYYVDGLRCRLEAPGPIEFDAQPWLPDAELPTAPGLYLLYLEARERPVTAVQDPAIREVALGGPDTTTRMQVVWQVKALAVTTNEVAPTCATTFGEWDALVAGPTGTLELRVAASAGPNTPCIVPETAGFTGIQNDVFRVQVHQGNFDPTAPGGVDPGPDPDFKWARDNASVVGSWRDHLDTLEVVVDRIGPGGTNGFDVGQWVELTSDDDELLDRPGIFAEVDAKTRNSLTLLDPGDASVSGPLTPVPQSDADRHTQVRRWDCLGARSVVANVADADVTTDGWIRIADGVEARFAGASWRTGDHWLVSARTAVLPGTTDRQIDWPVDGGGLPLALTPHGPVRHYARLALVDFDGTTWSNLRDCRRVVPPLAELVSLDHRGGDGQHARGGHWLPAPIRVGVTRGNNPVVGARVRLTVLAPGGGVVSTQEPDENGAVVGAANTLVATTDANGIAVAWWRLGPGTSPEEIGDLYQPAAAQRVEATLLDAADAPTHLATQFVAHVHEPRTLTPAGGDGQFGNPGETLEIALRVRIADDGVPVQGARVRFADLNRMLDGNNLDEFTGGAIHASANAVEITPWPGGSRTLEAVVETDADGEAQVQFILGTEVGLPVQRVSATLLDVNGQPTAQRHIFSAHLSIAREITWEPCPLLKGQLGGQFDVQTALQAMCTKIAGLQQFQGYVLAQLAALWNAVNDDGPQIVLPVLDDPFVLDHVIAAPGDRLTLPAGAGRDAAVSALMRFGAPAVARAEWVAGDGRVAPLRAGASISLETLDRIQLAPAFSLRNVPRRRRRLGVVVTAEAPLTAGRSGAVYGRQPVALEGTLGAGREGVLTWTPSEGARAWLASLLGRQGDPIAIEVSVDPAMLADEAAPVWRQTFFVER